MARVRIHGAVLVAHKLGIDEFKLLTADSLKRKVAELRAIKIKQTATEKSRVVSWPGQTKLRILAVLHASVVENATVYIDIM